MDFKSIGGNLLNDGAGKITPFGVVFTHGKEPEILYDGKVFPQYYYTADNIFTVGIAQKCSVSGQIAWLYLPCPDTCISKAVQRLGAKGIEDTEILEVTSEYTDAEILENFELEGETLHALNDLSRAVADMKETELEKLNAACEYAGATTAAQITALADILDEFDFCPDVRDAKQYGTYMIQDSGKFEYYPTLDEFYDYEGYGKHRMADEDGKFSELGYTVFTGSPKTLAEIIKLGAAQEQSQGQTPAVQDEIPVPAQEKTSLAPEFPYASPGQGPVFNDFGGIQTGQESGPAPGHGMDVEIYSSQPDEADEPEEVPEETEDEAQGMTGQDCL
jgi:hypothetical protein